MKIWDYFVWALSPQFLDRVAESNRRGSHIVRKSLNKAAWLAVGIALIYILRAGQAEAGSAQTSGKPASSASSILEPPSGAWLGQYYGAGSITQTAAKLGMIPRIHLTYYSWDADWTGAVTKADLAAGRIPLVNWEPHHIDFARIVDGSLDATINARAIASKTLGKKFFLDFAAEMNGDEAWSGNNAPLYVAAYRHIHDLFDAAGATNVVWVWCPNVTDTPGGNRNTMDYYPGDSYVDWTGVDGYNWGTKNGGWQSFHQVFQDIYPLLAAKKKPILIGEMSSSEAGGDKAKWIDEIIPTLRTSFPLIKGFVWFDINKEADWRISSSPATEASFIRMANDPYLNPQAFQHQQ
jgi:Glycosyl hydrolase family 26